MSQHALENSVSSFDIKICYEVMTSNANFDFRPIWQLFDNCFVCD